MRKLLICLPTFLLLASGINYSNYRSYYDTIYKVQTIDFNMLANSLPTKLSLALINKNKNEIQHTIDSNYGYFGIVVTNCLTTKKECQGESIIAKSQPEKAGWKEKAVVGKLSSHQFDLLRNPPPMTAEMKLKNARDKAAAKPTGRTNNGQIIGRVYYIRRDAPVDFVTSLEEWIGHGFNAAEILVTTGSVDRANNEWAQFLDYGANKFYILTNTGAICLGLFIWQWWKRSEEHKIRLEQDVNYLKNENSKLKDKINQLQLIIKRLKDRELSIKAKKDQISKDLEQLRERTSDFQERIEDKNKEIETVSNDLLRIQDEIEIARQRQSQQHLEESRGVIADLEDQMQVTLLRVEQLQGEKDGFKRDLSLLQGHLSNKEIELTECQSDLNEAILQLEQAEGQISSLQEQIRNSENSLNSSRIDNNRILELQAELSKSREELDDFTKSFDRDNDKTIYLTDRIKKIKRGIIVLRDKNINLDRDNQDLSKEINSSSKEIASLNNFIKSLSQKSKENISSQNISFSFKYYQDNHDKFNTLDQDSRSRFRLLSKVN